jgi:Flp pilus assembly protein TadD
MNSVATKPAGRGPDRGEATWKLCLQALVLILAGYWIYAPALHGGWLWDDTDEILHNPILRDPAGWWKIWLAPTGVDYFPLKTTLQWFLWHVGGARPALYHLTSLGLHGLSAFLFWRLLRRLGARLAWLGGLLFVVHPLAVESVAWISELKNTLSLPLLLLAMLAYIEADRGRAGRSRPAARSDRPATKAQPNGYYLLSLLLFLLAMLSKSSVVMFPAIILLYCWWKRGRIDRADLASSAPFFAVSAALGLITLWFQHSRAIGDWTAPVGGPGSRLISAGLAVAFYLAKSVFPIGLLPIYPQWSLRPLSFWEFLPWPVLAILLGWFWAKRSSWGRPALFGAGFFLLNLLPVLGFAPMAYLHISWVADHFAYISVLGIIGLAIAGAGSLPRSYLAGLATVAVGMFAWQSHAYAAWFRSEEILWTRTLRRDPSLWMAHKNLGYTFFEQGRDQDAIDQYEAALRLKPDFPEARNNLGSLLAAHGHEAEAKVQFQEALRLAPHYAKAHNNLGIALALQGDLAGAIAEYTTVLRLQADFPEARNNLGKALAELGQLPEAIAQFEEALRLDPGNAEAHNNLGNALAHSGRLPEAVTQFQAALRLKPDLALAHSNLGTAFFQLDRLPEARDQFVAALRLKADDAEVHNNYAVVLARSGDAPAAMAQYAEALRLKPDYADAHTNLANLLYRRGDARSAAGEYAAALRLQPENGSAHDRLGIALAALGRLEEARDQFAAALRLNPDDAGARANLEHAERDLARK